MRAYGNADQRRVSEQQGQSGLLNWTMLIREYSGAGFDGLIGVIESLHG
jgi:hypothetical protein